MRPGYPAGRGFTRPSTQELPRFRQGPKIPLLRPQALVFSPPPSSPTTSYQEDSTSDPAPVLPHLNPSLPPVYNVPPCTALLPDREDIFLSSDDEGGEMVFSPPPSSPTTSYQEDSTSDPAPVLPHLNPSLPPVYNVPPCTALLPDREEIFLSSDDEGGEMVPVSLPVLPATITISRVG